jgi:DNA-binding CsgD family transcriptional regulator/N-acetylneuraminic acid mutarotase
MEPKEIQRPEPANAPLEPSELSDREREILILVAGGASNKEVAQRLIISPNTVKVHLRNIFGKIGVSSRTEAALFAVRAGLVRVAVTPPPGAEAEVSNGLTAEIAVAEPPATVIPLVAPTDQAIASVPPPPLAPPRLWSRPAVWLASAALLLVALAGLLVVPRLLAPPTPPPATSAPVPTSAPRWQPRAALPNARGHLAAVTFENLVYAIGGETDAGVTGLTERYDAASDAWTALAPKPLAVADASAAVIGGLLYVPGGRLSSGAVTDAVEAYDPIADKWSPRAPLPEALSGYALAAFEGRLYVFGGWNGASYVAGVYEYNPAADVWVERTRMPTARGFAAAALSGGKIYVIGGADGQGASRAVEAYVPARDSEVANPWQSLPEAPASLSVVAATSIADTLYVTGRDAAASKFVAWEFRPEQASWQPLERMLDPDFSPSWLSVVAVQTKIYVIGAPPTAGAPAPLLAYQALYTNLIPVVTTGQ